MSATATVLASASLLANTASPALALDVEPSGRFEVHISVETNGGASGLVKDTLVADAVYTTVLSATGGGTCTLTSPSSIITGEDDNVGNPVSTHVDGGCDLFNGAVTYTLTWTTLAGISGQLQRTCAWDFRGMLCSPGDVVGRLPSGLT